MSVSTFESSFQAMGKGDADPRSQVAHGGACLAVLRALADAAGFPAEGTRAPVPKRSGSWWKSRWRHAPLAMDLESLLETPKTTAASGAAPAASSSTTDEGAKDTRDERNLLMANLKEQ